jgi:hypothetical protein
MVEPEKGVGVDQEATEAADYVGWLVRLDITDSRARRGGLIAEEDDAGLEGVLRLIEADFKELTVPILGRSERVLPSRSFFRLRKVVARWKNSLFEKTGDTSLFRVRLRLEPAVSDAEISPEQTSDRIAEELKRGQLVEIQIQNVGGEFVSSRALLGRFHPDHQEPNIFDALEDTRRLREERQRKENEGGA